MPFAAAAASAIIKPISSKLSMLAFAMPIAAVDAINKFEGPANGMRFNPKDVRKRIT